MSRHIGRATLLVAFAVLSIPADAGKPELSGTKWLEDLKAAYKVSIAETKPMVVVFGSERCFYCRKLERSTLSQPAISQYLGQNFVPVYLDFNQHRRAAEILKVDALPTTLVLTPQAVVLGRANGYVKPEKLRSVLVTALKSQARVRTSSGP